VESANQRTRFVSKLSLQIGQSASVAPKVLEARGRQFGVAHGVLDVSMAEVRLQGARVGARTVCWMFRWPRYPCRVRVSVPWLASWKTAGMPEHVRVGLEAKLVRDAQPRHHLAPSRRGEGRAALRREQNGDGGSWSRLSRRSARSSTPLNGRTDGAPFLAH
jgi:hypothetical protein